MKTGLQNSENASSAVQSWWLFLPFAVLLALAGYLGLRMGQPLTETDIITHFAAHYVTQNGVGAAMTDCFGMPSDRPDVRLVVVCTHDNGTVFEFPSGPRGELRPLDPAGGGV